MPPRTALRASTYALFFLSGATSLVYEVIWLRQLVLIFGSTLFATSAILSTFMAGLALGAMAGGRLAPGPRGALRVYGVLEVAIGLYALAVPALLQSLAPVHQRLWELGASSSFVALSAAKFVGIAVVLLPPTVLMGATLPVIARLVARSEERIGGDVGRLYAVNTTGAVLGAALAGFTLIPLLGMRGSLVTTAATSVLVGVLAWVVDLRGHAPGGDRRPEAPPEVDADSAPPGEARPAGWRLAGLAIIALSGFTAMVLEVAWTRVLALVVGSSVYSFTIMLVTFLLGLAAGAAFVAWRLRSGAHPGRMLAILLGAAGVLAWASALAFPLLPRAMAEAHFRFDLSPTAWLAVQFGLAFVVMAPATFAFGGIFPAVLQLHARDLRGVSRSVGTVYASNTAGTIAGAVLAGFVLIPAWGVRDTVLVVAAAEVALGLVAVLALVSAGRRARLLLATALGGALLLVVGVRPEWNVLLMNSGVYFNVLDFESDAGWNAFFAHSVTDNRLLYAREGLTSSVVVGEQRSGNRFLAVNGKVDASTDEDLETQVMSGHLPLLLHPDPRDVLVIGLASGISAGAVASHPVSSVRVLEIEEAIVGAARFFEDINGGVLDDPRVSVSINDARNELEFSPRTYDVITSEPSNPWMTVASNLFTEDFFRIARRRLRPGGIFCQWLQTYCLPPQDLRSVVAAYRAVFPHVSIFRTFDGVDLLMLGSDRPLALDLAGIDARMSELRVRMSLARVGVRSAVDVLPLLVVGDREIDGLVAGVRPNTDDNARVEFSAPRALYLGGDTVTINNAMLDRCGSDPLMYVESSPPGIDTQDRLRLALAAAWLEREEPARARSLLDRLRGGPLREEAVAFLASHGLL